jgi:hypothetical protein
MNCLEFRRKLAVEPASSVVDFLAHREACPRCAEAYGGALAFEGGLRRALSVPVPEGLADRILLRQTTAVRAGRNATSRFSGWRMAAALALAVGAAGMLLLNPSRDALAAEAVAHLAHEPYALAARAEIDAQLVSQMFAERGVQLVADPGRVTYANLCPIAGDRGVHLVVQETSGPVTVYFLPTHRSDARQVWERNGVKGRTIPVGEGTLVLLGSHDDSFDELEQTWQRALGAGSAVALR